MQEVLESPRRTETPDAPDAPEARRAARWGLAATFAVAIVCFALIAPTLTWLEFSSGSENLNVATALEILREDRWLLPTLDGEPRVAKPPLTAWITASSISDET